MNIAETVKLLTEARDAYYNTGTPIMSDLQFDALEGQLRAHDPLNSYFMEIGAEERGEKVKLPVPMGSLDQVYENGAENWVAEIGYEDKEFVLTDKLDGLSGLIIYGNDGKLQIGYSRGNGLEGADITRHLLKIKNLPKEISHPLMTRVEIIMKEETFKTLNESGALGRTFKNSRNYCAGQMNRKVADQVFYDNVDVVAYEEKNMLLSKVEQLSDLSTEGLLVPGFVLIKGSLINDAILMTELQNAKSHSPYALDGLVIDVNDWTDVYHLGQKNSSSLNPVHARKFKINSDANRAITKVVTVHWNVSKLGYLKPRVQIEPVDITGVTITYATGFNAKFIKDNMIGVGAEIQITRSGDVIPFIEKIITPAAKAEMPDAEEFGETVWSKNLVDLVLVEDHADAKMKRLCEFFGGVGVATLRQGNMERLIAGGLDTIELIVKASEEDLKAAVGEANGTKIYEGIKVALNPVPLWKLAGASQLFGRGIGQRKLKKVWEKYGDDNFLTLTYDLLLQVEGFSEISAMSVLDNMHKYLALTNAIAGYYTLEQAAGPSSDKFADLNVCFTGVRDTDLEKLIVDNGGSIASGVNAKTTHLVCKDSSASSSKLKKAAEIGVKVISLVEAKDLWK